MKLDRAFFHSPAGQFALVGLVLVIGAIAVRWQHAQGRAASLPLARTKTATLLPKTFTREVARFPKFASAAFGGGAAGAGSTAATAAALEKPRILPLALFATKPEEPPAPPKLTAPFGRLIPCETIVALESNRLETPVIGLVTEDIWHEGRRVIPAGAEVHGRAALDRTRERLAAEGAWRIVWRTRGPDNGTELAVTGLALDREFDGATGQWGEHDGSAGLRGEILKSAGERELKLFAATFLSSASAALQQTRAVAGLIGEASVPVATARNGALAGTGAVLREYAQQLREAIARDGFYLRVPAGKPFYLYVTQTLDRGPVTSDGARGAALKPEPSHEN